MKILPPHSQREDLMRQLEYGLTSMKTPLDKRISELLLDYLELLQKWNHVYNLTAIRDIRQMVSTHLLDSLSVLPYIPGDQILDVGAGAGLPGIPLAAALKSKEFSLIESNQKKSAFLRQAVAELQLPNAQVICQKVEECRIPRKFTCIIARAYAEIAKLVDSSKHLLAPDGIFAAMKGRHPQAEIEKMPAGFVVRELIELKVPGLDAERHLVLIGQK